MEEFRSTLASSFPSLLTSSAVTCQHVVSLTDDTIVSRLTACPLAVIGQTKRSSVLFLPSHRLRAGWANCQRSDHHDQTNPGFISDQLV